MRVITFSRFFPAKHPRKGEPTYFVEKIAKSLPDIEELHPASFDGKYGYDCNKIVDPKHHTIRAGNRWKVGDLFSPRVWSGLPYRSKQIEIVPPIEIKKTFEIYINLWQTSPVIIVNGKNESYEGIKILCKNDGLSVQDFTDWFMIHPKKKDGFTGQILCWNENINY